jgi:hypothetical protein
MKVRSQSSSIPTKRSKLPSRTPQKVCTVRRAVAELMRHGEERNAAGMARFALRVDAKPAWVKAFSWLGGKQEFEKRAGFALAAYLGIHDRSAPDPPFRKFLRAIEREARDERNFVRNAVHWTLGNMGKTKAKAKPNRNCSG